ncbi:MAG: hypothetical protein AB7J28_04505 [Hyphomonadaceae bacterium]
MRARLFTILIFISERIRVICLALALIVAAKIVGGVLVDAVSPRGESEAIAQP